MKVFYPINEFNEAGFVSLPCLTYLTDKIVLWSPMTTFINENDKKTILKSEHILELVEDGMIQIALRETAFDKSLKNDTPFEKEKYTNFYKEVRSIWGKSGGDSKILVFGDEIGYNYADQTLESNNEEDKIIVGKAKKIINSVNLPIGIKEKIDREEKKGIEAGFSAEKIERNKIRQLLRDSKNNFTSINETGSDTMAFWNDQIPIFNELSRVSIDNSKEVYDNFDPKKFVEMCEYMQGLGTIKNYETYRKSLEKRDLIDIKHEMSNLFSSDVSPDDYISDMINGYLDNRRNNNYMKIQTISRELLYILSVSLLLSNFGQQFPVAFLIEETINRILPTINKITSTEEDKELAKLGNSISNFLFYGGKIRKPI
ncbi:hypothetical protein [Acetobacterium tundrae]|uniref:Uncharacterized protein n=1 Tax=Acetobacterium tundrae TaxID=132932 RepID=A0ABR6WNM1_9FIRM|nr:hypothetical protein [Acetobacterium tundrae]MBC3798007.1 hypothetical protein [Acetobacterium tundrae]